MKRHMAELHCTVQARQGYWMRVVLDLHRGVQNLDDVLTSRHGHLQVVPAEAQVADGFEKTLDIQNKGDQTASAEVAGQDQRTTIDHHQRNPHNTEQLNA